VNKTVNVTNVTYQNQAVAGAVTATSHQAFTSAQPVGRNMVQVNAKEVATAQVAPIAPSVAPPKQAVLGAGAAATVKPPAALATRAVVAKTTPPPAPVSFAKQQQLIQANGGQPPAISQMRQAQTETGASARANVKVAPPVTSAGANVQANKNAASNPNKPAVVNAAGQPGNASANPVSSKAYTDRPPASRPNNAVSSNNVNAQLDQKHQQQLQDLRSKQDQERQKVEQQQVQERQKLADTNADEQKQAALAQKHQQQLETLEQKHDQEQAKLQQKQSQERQKAQKQDKPPKEEKPHKGN